MCRNIKTLFNFDPPATEVEIRDASLQFVSKLGGFNVPSKANEVAFERAIEDGGRIGQSSHSVACHNHRAAQSRSRGSKSASKRRRQVWSPPVSAIVEPRNGAPNPSIEGTSSSRLRLLPSAPHVKR
jgi:hypothetical protein